MTIDSLAELGPPGTTLAQIAGSAGVSPGLVAHYFADKDGLLAAAFRALVARVNQQLRWRLAGAGTPRARIRAIIDAHLSPEEFDERIGRAWLAFWSQVPQVEGLARIQRVYQRRLISNLRSSLGQLLRRPQALELAAVIAALIDGTWLQAALAGLKVHDSEGLRNRIGALVDVALENGTGTAESIATPRTAGHNEPTAIAGERLASTNPATGELLGYVPVAGVAEVDSAVQAARAAQPRWAAMSGAERARILRRAAEILRSRNDALAELETRDTGKPIQETRVVDVISGAECLEYFAALAQSAAGEHIDLGPSAFGYTRREALGVVAGIGAWNYPLQIACWKSAPALAFGNAMIFKPAELTPLSAVELEKAFLEAGLPRGIFQVVQGRADTGRLLTRHPAISKVSLTGEVGTGRAVMGDASASLKHVTLELGGKSPLIIFEDARLDQAVSGALLANFYSAGEVCSNATRVFVQRPVKAEFLRRLLARVGAMRIGDPMDPATQVGSLISAEHLRKVLSY
ncbi:MAG: transcriptional regulator BetI, partial [Steroidobacteraceae bacterium]